MLACSSSRGMHLLSHCRAPASECSRHPPVHLASYHYAPTATPITAAADSRHGASIFNFLCSPSQYTVLYFCWTILTLLIGVYVYVYISLF